MEIEEVVRIREMLKFGLLLGTEWCLGMSGGVEV